MTRRAASWRDVNSFLLNAGYLSAFRARTSRNQILSLDTFCRTVNRTFKSNPEHVEWLQKWGDVAMISRDGVSQDDLIRVFFEIAWHLHCNNEPQARKALERGRRGCIPPNSGLPHGTEPNGMRNFVGIPSGLKNAQGERSDSPLSSVPDEDSDSNERDSAPNNRKACARVPSGFSSSDGKRSNSPLPPLPDSVNDDPSPEDPTKSLSSHVEQSGYSLRRRPRVNYRETAVSWPKPVRHVSYSAEKDDLCSEDGQIAPGTSVNLGDTITITRRKRKQRRITPERESARGHAIKIKRGFKKRKAALRPSSDRRSQQHIFTMRHQKDIETQPSGQRSKLRSHRESVKVSSMSSSGVRAMNHVTRRSSSLAHQIMPRRPLLQRKTKQLNKASQMKKAVQGKNRHVSKQRIIRQDGNISGQKPTTPPRVTIKISSIETRMKSKNASQIYQTDEGAGMDVDPAISSLLKKRFHSEVVTSENSTQMPEEERPRKRSRIHRSPSADKACNPSEPIADPPVPTSLPPASDFHLLEPDPALDQPDFTVSSSLQSDMSLLCAPNPEHTNSTSHRRATSPPSDKLTEPVRTICPKTPTTTSSTITPNDTPESSQSTLVGPSPINKDPITHDSPPWGRKIDPSNLPNSARGPGESDTHAWHPPRCLPICFPPQCSHVDVDMPVRKPPLPMAPPVWAQARLYNLHSQDLRANCRQSRQELCESLPYFRSYQGGVYSRGKKALGYLLDGHPAAHDIWHADGKIIISHAGGNSAVDKDTKQTMLVNDQTISSVSCAALINSFKCGQPIFLIAGNEYNLFPYNLEHRSYVVLGCYLITQAWEEPEPSRMSPRGYFVRWKFLFQWINTQGQPWWIQNSVPSGTSPIYSHQLSLSNQPEASTTMSCSDCRLSTPQIYNFGWVCTSSTCPSFFIRKGDGIEDQEGYLPTFLIPRAGPSAKYEPSRLQIRPGLPVNLEQDSNRETTTRRFWNGFWCKHCGKLSCREYWTHWECSNCHEKFQVKHRLRSPSDGTLAIGRIKFQPEGNSGIKASIRRVRTGNCLFNCRVFELPWNRGVICLIEANRVANAFADEIFLQYQRDAEDPAFFRRYSMKTHKLKGRMLSHYFSQNSGETYKYVGGTENTVPLDKYSSVRQAVNLIRERVSAALQEDPLFNEILSAAYMADQKMEFHSDGEKDLGPVVASLSLGAPATMRFRPVPARVKPSISEEASDNNVRKKPSTVLTLTLRHGDVLVMAGAEIQEFYQHAVHPSGFRIAATARYIKTHIP